MFPGERGHSSRGRDRDRGFRSWVARACAIALVAVGVSVVPVQIAVAAPEIQASKSAPAQVRSGAPITYSITVTNPSSNPDATFEWNVGIADTLPEGVTYVPGSTTPAAAGDPNIVTDPDTGQQTLTWSNTADVVPDDTFTLTFQVLPDPDLYPVGSTVPNPGADVYASTDPTIAPVFDANGDIVPGTATENASTGGTTTQISAIELTKTEPSPEGELLRGVHANTTVYTLTVNVGTGGDVNGLSVVDLIPASIEFLGCGGVENSSGPEYLTAPSLAATPVVPGCVDPVSVTTVVNPPPVGGVTYPAGVYTRVEWDITSVSAAGTATFPYAAGIPLNENAAWPGAEPGGLAQIANLDNNTGPSTRETATEASATNYASVTGTYTGPVAPGTDPAQLATAESTVTIEDIRMRKEVSPATFQGGDVATYTLTIDSSEYVSGSNIVITDSIPAGICPLGGAGENFADGSPAVCDGSAATEPSSPFDTVTDNGDGTFTLVFAPVTIPADGTLEITYSGRMLTEYLAGPRAGEPTTAGDTFTNTVELDGETTPILVSPESGTEEVTDESSATQTTVGPTYSKLMLPRSLTSATCPTDPSLYEDPDTLSIAERTFILGDSVCFRLRVDFPTNAETRGVTIADFLPRGMSYVLGSAQDTDVPGGTLVATKVVSAEAPAGVTWDVGTPAGGTPRYVEQGAVFDVVLEGTVTASTLQEDGEIRANQMKLGGVTADGSIVTFRDFADVNIAPAPPISTVKGVESVDSPASGPNGANSNVDGSEVRAGSVATFRIDLTNDGTGIAGYLVGGAEVWDVLAAGIACADVSNVRIEPTPGTAPIIECTDPGDSGHPDFAGSDELSLLRVTQPFDPANPEGLEPGETASLLYDVTIPADAGVSTVYTDTAYVRSYQAVTDTGEAATYYPQDNIDESVPAEDQLADPSFDSSNVVTPGVVVEKSATTSITEAGNNTPNQATLGELITWTYSVTVPANTSVFSGRLADNPWSGYVIEPPAELTYYPDADTPVTAAVPAGVAFDPATGTVNLPTTYVNDTDTDQRFEVTLVTLVPSSAMTPSQNNQDRANTARFTSLSEPGGSALPEVTAVASVNLRQPAPSITKSNDSPTVIGGQVVTFTISVTTPTSGGNRPPLHDAFVIDCVPAGLIFDAYGTTPGLAPVPGDGTNGCAAGETVLVWDLDDLEPGEVVNMTYTATVNNNPVGGDVYTNTATLTGSSLDDDKAAPADADDPDEATYTVVDTSSVTVAGAEILKSVTPGTATIGEEVTWTVTVTIPADTVFFDSAVIDHIPAGISAPIILESVTCTVQSTPQVACPGLESATVLTPDPQPDGSRFGGMGFADAGAIPFERTLQVVYSGTVTDDPVNVAGRLVTNSAFAGWNLTNGDNPTSTDATFDLETGDATATFVVTEPDVSVTKDVDDATPGPTDDFTYSLVVANATGSDVSDAFNIVITDVVPTGVVVDAATISNGGVLTGADPVNGGGTITWTDPLEGGGLAPGETIELQYTASLAPSASLTADPLTNTATVTSYESLPSGGRLYVGPSDTATITPAFPELTTTKAALDPAPAYIDEPFTWEVTVTNTGGAPAYGVDIADTLPTNWSYETGTATIAVAGGTPTAREPAIGPGGSTLAWANVSTLEPGESAVVTFQATPSPDVVDDPGVGSTVPHINSAVAEGEDATGATGNADGSYSNGPGTAQTRIDSADLTIAKTHTAPVVAGSDFTWNVTVTNLGADTAVGPFQVADTLPTGVTLVSATGAGWSCAAAGLTVTCARTTPTETLASGASLPTIAIVVAVPSTTDPGTELTNTASVDGRTFDPDESNNTDEDTAIVTAEADLQVVKEISGEVVPGTNVTWTIDVTNLGPSVAEAPVELVDTLPPGTTYVSATGTGWTCGDSGQTVTCTRGELAVGPAPQITLVAAIDPAFTGDLTNTATVTSPTPDPDESNNTDEVTEPVTPVADLAIEKSHVGDFTAGTEGSYVFDVVNNGPSDAAGDVEITDTLPDTLTYQGFSSTDGWTCSASGQDVTCTLAAGLAADGETEVTIDVLVAADAPAEPIVNEATVESPTTDPIEANNTDDDISDVDLESDLAITKSHVDDAVAGENFSWTVVVTNNGPSDTPGPIVVTDALPQRSTFVSATGTGWVCSANGQIVTCTYAAGLANLEVAPEITVTVGLPSDLGPAQIVNVAAVNGPVTDTDLSNNTAIDPTDVIDITDVQIEKEVVGPTLVPAGSEVQYTLTATNNGPSDADNAVVVDTAPVGLTPTAVSTPDGSGWTCGIVARTVTCVHGSAPVGASGVITVTAVTDAALPAGTELTNTATIATSTEDDDPNNNSDDATIELTTSADLSVVKTHEAEDGGQEVAPGEDVTFTIAIHNAGPSVAAAPITVIDTLPEDFTFVSAAAPWTCTADLPSPGQVTCTWSAGALAVDADAPDLVMTVATDPSITETSVDNLAEVTSPTPDPDIDNNTDIDVVPLVPVADVSIVKTHTGDPVVGGTVDFTLLVSNAGPSDAADVVVTDTLPAALDPVSASGTGWACEVTDQLVECALDAPLAVGADAAQITLTATVLAAAYPQVTNTAEVTTSADDPDGTNNEDSDTLDVPPAFDLGLSKSHIGDFVVGEQARWLVTVSNLGPTAAPGPTIVTDVLPTGITYVSSIGPAWSCGAVGQLVTCVHTGSIAVGQTLLLSLNVRVGPEAYPGVENTARVSSPGETGPDLNNADSDAVEVIPVSYLEIEKTVVDQEEDRVVYELEVTNEGPNDTTTDVVVTDTLPAGLAFVSVAGDGWTCATSGATVSCSYPAPLVVGDSAPPITLTADIMAPPGTEILNVASVDGGQPDPCPECGDTDDAEITSAELSGTGFDDAALALYALLLVALGGGLLFARRIRVRTTR